MIRCIILLALILSIAACGGDPSDPNTGAGEVCTPNASRSCGNCLPEGQMYSDGGAQDEVCGSQSCQSDGTWAACQGPNTPLVLAFDDEAVQFAEARVGANAFDLGQGPGSTHRWPTAATPWLVLDRDGNGRIDDGRELFGSFTDLGAGRKAANGFEALAALDANGDGRIDARDPAWPELMLWADGNGDHASAPEELVSLASRGVTAIELGFRVSPRCDGRGDCEVERAGFSWRDARGGEHTGAVIDVHLTPVGMASAMR